MQVFDENGKAVNETPSFDCSDVGATFCPNCGCMMVHATDVEARKQKVRICPKCGNEVGKW